MRGFFALSDVRLWPRLGQKRLDFGVAGTAHHIGNELSAFKTSSPTSVTCQSKFRSYLPPALVIFRFDAASAVSRRIRWIAAVIEVERSHIQSPLVAV